MMQFEESANRVLSNAYNDAREKGYEYITTEHFLYMLLSHEDGKQLVTACGGDVKSLKLKLSRHLKENIPIVSNNDPIESYSFQNVIQGAAMHVAAAGKETVRVGDLLAAIFDEKESFAAYYLKSAGVKKLTILEYISHGSEFDEFPDLDVDDDVFFDDEDDEFEAEEKLINSKDFLKNFTYDITERAVKNELDPVIGREDILQRTIQVLCRRLKNNPIHVGDPGVGKTAITEGLAQMIVKDEVPDILKGFRILYLDMGAMVAGAKYRGDFEQRLKKVLKEVQTIEKAIIYIDEIHTIIGAGASNSGSVDAANIIKPFLQSGKLRVIGCTTYDEYKKIFDKDRALSRRFQKIEIPEPTVEQTIDILNGLIERYEEYHNVKYSPESIRLTAELSSKYINDRYLPDKAIDIIDESGANARINAKNGETAIVDLAIIEKTISLMAKIPENSVSSNDVDKLKVLESELQKVIFGQNKAINSVVKAIKRSRAGFNTHEKPVASFLFVGPTGVGKTELCRKLSEVFGIPLLRFDMSEYQERHTVARLIGSPPGYVGYDEGGLLTDAIRKTPHCVLLLDEIEKAHEDIYNVLLQIMDYATLTENNGKKVDFKNVILIMTSNAGAREIGRSMVGFGERRIDRGNILREVERVFSPEFRNRLDEIVTFNPLDKDMSMLITKTNIDRFKELLFKKNIDLEVTQKCYEWIAEKGYSSIYGAREILRQIEEHIKTFFVDEVLFGKLTEGGRAIADLNNNKIDITVL